ncbi:hypothetical protein ACFU3O_11160 [Streptomyces antibioticus]|uniref:hypothetical protein n=1 Tax=Streptomyces antibioticus TaxID=1890 RepID=UPI0036C95645
MLGCLGVVLFLVVVGEFLVLPVWMHDLLAAQTPPQELGFGETALLTLGSLLVALVVVWTSVRRRPGMLWAAAGRAVLLLGLCLAAALGVRQQFGTEYWNLLAAAESLAAGATAFGFRRLLRRWERGRPQPGEVWLALVPFRDRDEEAQHYCVVVGRGPGHARVLQITSQNKDGRAGFVRMPNDGWDVRSGKDHWMELGPVPREVPYRKFLKEYPQGPCPRPTWRQIRAGYPQEDPLRAVPAGVRRVRGRIARLRAAGG